MDGFHAGEMVWAVYQDAPGREYQCRLSKIDSATRDGDKVTYRVKNHTKPLSERRIFGDTEAAQRCCDKLNAARKKG